MRRGLTHRSKEGTRAHRRAVCVMSLRHYSVRPRAAAVSPRRARSPVAVQSMRRRASAPLRQPTRPLAPTPPTPTSPPHLQNLSALVAARMSSRSSAVRFASAASGAE